MKKTGQYGIIELERPLARGISAVTVNDPTFSDLAGVITGMKPVTYTDCAPAELPRIVQPSVPSHVTASRRPTRS